MFCKKYKIKIAELERNRKQYELANNQLADSYSLECIKTKEALKNISSLKEDNSGLKSQLESKKLTISSMVQDEKEIKDWLYRWASSELDRLGVFKEICSGMCPWEKK